MGQDLFRTGLDRDFDAFGEGHKLGPGFLDHSG